MYRMIIDITYYQSNCLRRKVFERQLRPHLEISFEMQTTSVDDVLQNSLDIAMTYINRLISKVATNNSTYYLLT